MSSLEPTPEDSLHHQIRANFEASIKKSEESGEVDHIDAMAEANRQQSHASNEYYEEHDRDSYRAMAIWSARSNVLRLGGYSVMNPILRERLVKAARIPEFEKIPIEQIPIPETQKNQYQDAEMYVKYMSSPRGTEQISNEIHKDQALDEHDKRRHIRNRIVYWQACNNLTVYNGLAGLHDFDPATVSSWAAKYNELPAQVKNLSDSTADTTADAEVKTFAPGEVADAKAGLNHMISIFAKSQAAVDQRTVQQLQGYLTDINANNWDNVPQTQMEKWINLSLELAKQK